MGVDQYMEAYLSAGPGAPAERRQTAPLRLLVCDDNTSMRSLLQVTFDLDERFEVVGEAATGMEAIFQAGRLHPDIVLLDLAMPVMDGLTAISEIKRIAPSSRIVIFSGFNADRLGQRACELGAEAFIEKGIPPKELVAQLVSIGGGSSQPVAGPVDLLSDARVFKNAFEGATLGIGIGDAQGRPVFVNETLERMLGYGTGELDGVPMDEITHPDDLEKNKRLLDELVAGTRLSYTYEKRFLQKDGTYRRARVTASLLRNDDTTYTLGMVRDLGPVNEGA